MKENSSSTDSNNEFDLVIEDPYAGKLTVNEGSHHHHHHHHSSHHGRHKKRHSTHKKAKKFKEPSIRFITCWLILLSLICMILAAWNIELNSSLKVNSDKIKALVNSKDPSTSVSDGNDNEGEAVPSYVRNEAESVIKTVSELQNENTFSFIAVSDAHLKSDDEQVVESIRHAGQAMKLIREGVDIDFAVSLGDFTWGSESTPIQTGINEIETVNSFIAAGFADIPNFRLLGNHDTLLQSYEQNQDYLDSAELYDLFGAYNEGALFPAGAETAGYCYRDLDEFKLRVICLNLNEIIAGETDADLGLGISPAQVDWFADTLDLSAKADSGEWSILIFSHQPLNWFENFTAMIDIIDGYTLGASGTVNVHGTEITYDYNGKNSAAIIANIHGHMHNYKTASIGTSRIPAVTVPNACFLRNNEYGTAYAYSEEIHNKYGEKVTYEKTAASAEDTAFCVITVDLVYNRIYVTNYGAGYDRDIGY